MAEQDITDLTPAYIFENNQKWAESITDKTPDFFINLAKRSEDPKGQRPSCLWIGCCDSRVIPELITNSGPGKIFVHRNIANLVGKDDLSVLGVIAFAVQYLNVGRIVVCGHTRCGGVQASLPGANNDAIPDVLNPWLNNIRDVYRQHKVELDNIDSTRDRRDRLAELSVIEQCRNVEQIIATYQLTREAPLPVSGYMYDLDNGRLSSVQEI
ncbi:carbonic anhydrase 2 [Lasiosphaeris hirsuta]|uniref:Carbonic anhydrase n=1 Tax=Lasiosphaeris hirsuta TaxID=260670 RepID=A0AA40B1Q7_9PEZI|nr:carbonic anhydrase 2 [Lasiosphaeris hirsuta]